MPLVSGQSGLKPTRNLGVQLTLLQAGGADHAHHITACPPGFENLTAPLYVSSFYFIVCSLTHRAYMYQRCYHKQKLYTKVHTAI